MIGLNIVYERDELLYSLDLHTDLSRDFSIDYLDFNNQSLEDIIDYIEFLEFEKYIFVAVEESVRLKRLVEFFRTRVSNAIQLVSIGELSTLLNINEVKNIQKIIENDIDYNNLININTKQIYKNGYNSFRSAIYPNLEKGLLKHIWVDQLDKFLVENEDLIIHFAVNSAIYCDLKPNYWNFPLILKAPSDISNEIFKMASTDELETAFKMFIDNGEVYLSNNILDYGVLTGISKFNSLVFDSGKFYLDSAKTMVIGFSRESYQKIYNQASLKLSDKTTTYNIKLIHLYPLFISLNRSYRHLNFITPFNKYNLPPIEENINTVNWLTFTNGVDSFALNIQNSRLFKINKIVLEKFEYIIKDKLNESDDTLTQELMEILKTYA